MKTTIAFRAIDTSAIKDLKDYHMTLRAQTCQLVSVLDEMLNPTYKVHLWVTLKDLARIIFKDGTS
jgi:hypothetical protein